MGRLSDLRGEVVITNSDLQGLRQAVDCLENGFPIQFMGAGEGSPINLAISLLADECFTTTEQYQQRVLALGKSPERVHWVGDPALDGIRLTPGHKDHVLLVDYTGDMTEIFSALEVLRLPTVFLSQRKEIEAFIKLNPWCKDGSSLKRPEVLKYLKSALAFMGDSRLGIVEGATFGTKCIYIGEPTIPTGNNVIQVDNNALSIIAAVQMDKKAWVTQNPYYKDGCAKEAIDEILKGLR